MNVSGRAWHGRKDILLVLSAVPKSEPLSVTWRTRRNTTREWTPPLSLYCCCKSAFLRQRNKLCRPVGTGSWLPSLPLGIRQTPLQAGESRPSPWNNVLVATTSKFDLYRLLPSVDELLHAPELAALIAREGQPPVTEAARAVLAQLREEISWGRLANSESVQLALTALPDAITRHLHSAMEFSLRPIINATGVILHTNLGRAPLAEAALKRISEVAGR